MRRFEQMCHLMDNHVFEQVLGVLHQFGIEADMPGPGITAAPLGFNPLQKVAVYLNFQFLLPLLDERRHGHVQQHFMPRMHHLGTLGRITARAYRQGDAPVVE